MSEWKFAMQLAKANYELTGAFSVEKRYGLAQQVRRVAVSILSNIAEGAGRNGVKEYLHFIGISPRSLAELETHIQLAVMLGVTAAEHVAFGLADHNGKLLTGRHINGAHND